MFTTALEILEVVAAKAVGIYGRVDALVNNAGRSYRSSKMWRFPKPLYGIYPSGCNRGEYVGLVWSLSLGPFD